MLTSTKERERGLWAKGPPPEGLEHTSLGGDGELAANTKLSMVYMYTLHVYTIRVLPVKLYYLGM